MRELEALLKAFAIRRLDETPFPYVMLDARLREGPRGGLERASTERGPEAERRNGKSVDR